MSSTDQQNQILMQAQCPKCETIFRFSPQQLEMADGLVCCGQCQQIFKAARHTPKIAALHDDLFDLEDLQSPTEAEKQPDDNTDPEDLRILLLGKTPEPKYNRLLWASGILCLCLLTTLQFAYIKRNEMADIPSLQPYIEKGCELIPHCKLSPKRDLNKIELLSRNVYTHPNVKGALMISAVLTNSATFTQAYPVLLVTMSNTRGKIVAQRYFSPAEYLGKNIDVNAGMRVGSAMSINLEIMDPGNQALAFELDFL